MKNFVQEGNIITVPAPAAVTSGDGVLVGVTFGVAVASAASGADFPLRITGVVTLPKATGAVSVGVLVYWDNSAKNVTTTASDTKIGIAAAAALSGDTTMPVRLNGAF